MTLDVKLLAGHVESMILHRSDLKAKQVVASFADCILDFFKRSSTAAPELPAAFNMLHNMKAILNSCSSLEILPKWVGEGKLTAGRVEILIDTEAKKQLKEVLSSGVQAAQDWVQKGNFHATDGFGAALNVLKHHKHFDNLDAIEFKPDLSEACTLVKKGLTLSSLSVEDVRTLFPDIPDKMGKFLGKLEEHLNLAFDRAGEHIKTGWSLISKYRTEHWVH